VRHIADTIRQIVEATFLFHFNLQLIVICVFMVLHISIGVDKKSDRETVGGEQ
jgi:hypothetical protein